MSSTHEREGLLRDVVEHPHEDGPRLVYADWCEENGDPQRAEFIRAQVEAVRLRERLLALDVRAAELARDLCERNAFGQRLSDGATTFRPTPQNLRRGFVDVLVLNLRRFWDHGRELVSMNPITQVRFSDRNPAVRRQHLPGATRRLHYYVGGWSPTSDPHGYFIPIEWLLLMNHEAEADGYHGHLSHDTAESALSEAALLWARQPLTSGAVPDTLP